MNLKISSRVKTILRDALSYAGHLKIVTCESSAKVVTIFGIKARAIDKVEATANHISCGKCWTINLSLTRATKGITIITMIAVRPFVPAR